VPEKYPNVGGFSEGEDIVWTPNTGDVKTLTWNGCYADVYAAFLARRAAAPGTADVFELNFHSQNGEATLYERRTRDDGSLTEEIFGVDVMKDVLTTEYFQELTNDEVVEVSKAYRDALKEGEPGGPPSGGWTGKKGSLYYHLTHGVEQLPETAWIFTQSRRAVRYRSVSATFANVNRVVASPAPESSTIARLITAVPAGEWLYKPPRVTSAGKGLYDVTKMWWWARQWSVALGGTFGAPA